MSAELDDLCEWVIKTKEREASAKSARTIMNAIIRELIKKGVRESEIINTTGLTHFEIRQVFEGR